MTLIARLEAAEVGSRELDAAIWGALIHPETKVISCHAAYAEDGTQVMFTLPPKRKEIATQRGGTYLHADAYTTSLDAALALAERVLPGWAWMVERHKDVTATAWIDEWNAYGEVRSYRGNTPALAMCIAILKAKEAEG